MFEGRFQFYLGHYLENEKFVGRDIRRPWDKHIWISEGKSILLFRCESQVVWRFRDRLENEINRRQDSQCEEYKLIGKGPEVGWRILGKEVFSKRYKSQIKRYKTETNGREIYGEQ